MDADSTEKLQKYEFPKKVGIIFLERRKRAVQEDVPRSLYKDILLWKKRRNELKLVDFDQDACAFLLLQLNHYQNIFEFQVVNIPESDEKSLIPKNDDKKDLFEWVDKFVLENSDLKNIDYWIGITNELIPGQNEWHFNTKAIEETATRKRLWIITSLNWEKYRSPPSLFEYLLATVYRCALESLSRHIHDDKLKKLEGLEIHNDKISRGCIFDFTHRRASVSIFKLCFSCKNKLSLLEEFIWKQGTVVNLVDDVTNILSKEWMGTPEKRDSPLFALKKVYKYDVDRNSGFNKRFWEKFRDSISDNLAQWTVGTVVAGMAGIIVTIVSLYFTD